MAEATLRLRPFRVFLERAEGVPVVEVSGTIEGERFIVRVFGHDTVVDTARVEADPKGAYALVHEGEWPLPDDFKLRTEIEYDEDGLPPCGCILIYREGEQREAARAKLRERGEDPDKAILVAPYERCHSIYFHCDGTLESTGGGERVRTRSSSSMN